MMGRNSRDTFIFYRSFHEAISDLNDGDKLLIYEAIIRYALDRVDPGLTGFPGTVFKLIRPQLDANWKRYENGCKGAEYGVEGGAPQGNQNARKTTPNQPQDNSKTTPNKNNNRNNNKNENRNSTGTKFVPPSLSEFENYFIENGYSAEVAKRAFTGYDVAEWKDSTGKPIKNWKQKCVHVWFKPENKSTNTATDEKPNYAF